jgi:ubiquinone/menaquinone biosynthesis C-methylase UbiE
MYHRRVGFYDDRILPHVIALGMGQARLLPYRRRVTAMAQGRVLEIGVGSGPNLRLYSGPVLVLGIDSSTRLLSMARGARPAGGCPVNLIEGSAEALPLEAGSIDTVVTTWTLCSIPDVGAALREARRALKPSGRLLFVEHGRSPDEKVRRWQDRLTPVWKRVAGGCHLNRPIAQLVEDAGFVVERLETGYMDGPRPMTFMYEGTARPR